MVETAEVHLPENQEVQELTSLTNLLKAKRTAADQPELLSKTAGVISDKQG